MAGLRTGPPQRAALVVLVGIAVLTIAFLIMIFVNVSNESVIALAVIATPIASMVAAYYAVTLSIQQVRTERDDKERALAKLEAVQENARETEIWASQMESGLRVAMAKLDGAGVSTSAVTRAAGTPDDFF
jgi:phosphate/sulfate permease